jgi:hypothetical protein
MPHTGKNKFKSQAKFELMHICNLRVGRIIILVTLLYIHFVVMLDRINLLSLVKVEISTCA